MLYTVLRLLAFAVPFGIMMIFPIFRELYWLAAIFAALIGLSLSTIFLRRPLAEVTTGLAERRVRRRARTDDEVEDALADHGGSEGASSLGDDRGEGDQPKNAHISSAP